MVHLNQCTKAHVLKIVGELNETRCRVFELKSSGDVAAGKESEILAVRTVHNGTDVQHKNRQK